MADSAFQYSTFTTLGRGTIGGWQPAPSEGFLKFFFLKDKTSAPNDFGSYSFIPRAHFETSLVMVSYYGYEIWRHKEQVVKPFLSENACFFNFFQK